MLLLNACVYKKRVHATFVIEQEAVLVECKTFTSNMGLFFTGQEELTCLKNKERAQGTGFKSIPVGSRFQVKRLLEWDSIDAGMTGYLIGTLTFDDQTHTDIYIYARHLHTLTNAQAVQEQLSQ